MIQERQQRCTRTHKHGDSALTRQPGMKEIRRVVIRWSTVKRDKTIGHVGGEWEDTGDRRVTLTCAFTQNATETVFTGPSALWRGPNKLFISMVQRRQLPLLVSLEINSSCYLS